jgi:hypothetical protein
MKRRATPVPHRWRSVQPWTPCLAQPVSDHLGPRWTPDFYRRQHRLAVFIAYMLAQLCEYYMYSGFVIGAVLYTPGIHWH